MKDHDPSGKLGPSRQLPDIVKIHEPKEEEVYIPPPEIEQQPKEYEEGEVVYGDPAPPVM